MPQKLYRIKVRAFLCFWRTYKIDLSQVSGVLRWRHGSCVKFTFMENTQKPPLIIELDRIISVDEFYSMLDELDASWARVDGAINAHNHCGRPKV